MIKVHDDGVVRRGSSNDHLRVMARPESTAKHTEQVPNSVCVILLGLGF
jgi:hypothetical protein